MRILHLSDLHFKKSFQNEISERMSPLISVIKKINSETPIDLIIFTGDLVFAGSVKDDFHLAEKIFITPILESLSLAKRQFIMCPGNHDIDADVEIVAIKEYIDKRDNNSDINEMVKKNDQNLELSLTKMINYHQFIIDFYEMRFDNKLFQTFKTRIDEREIGIASFNSAWRSFKGNHSKKILIPTIVIDNAVEELFGSDIFVSLEHHPIDELKDFNRSAVEDILCEKFHINFSGHQHKNRSQSNYNCGVGMHSNITRASMSGADNALIGFDVVDFNLDSLEINTINYEYLKGKNIFLQTDSSVSTLPMNEEKASQVSLMKRIKDEYEGTLYIANNLLINNTETSSDFLVLYEDHILKEDSQYKEGTVNMKSYKIGDLLENNFLIYGRNKYGKTSLLRRVQIEILRNYKTEGAIPVFIDFKEEKTGIDIIKMLSRFLRLTRNKTEDLLKKNIKIIVLIDNFDSNLKTHIENLKGILDQLTNFSFILTSEEKKNIVVEELLLGAAYKCQILYIHSVNRKSIRNQVTKILPEFDTDEKEKVTREVSAFFKKMNIPFNHWHLSMFLLIYKKENAVNMKDNIDLIQLYVDKLLDKENINTDPITYGLLNSALAKLAHKLLTEDSGNNYTIEYSELVTFFDNYRKSKIRFVVEDIKDLISSLLKKGVLFRNPVNDRYSFRLDGIMEYFTALYMLENSSFVDGLLKDNTFLNFSNEIEILAGLERKNEHLLSTLFEKTFSLFNGLNESAGTDHDSTLNNFIKNPEFFSNLLLHVEADTEVSTEIRDDMLDRIDPLVDNAEGINKKPCKFSELDVSSLDFLEKNIYLLSRVFRASSGIDNDDLIKKSFDLLIASYINYSFLQFKSIQFETDDKKSSKKIEEIIKSFLPLFTQMIISESVLHKSLSDLIKEKIKLIEENASSNQYLLFLFYFLLLDADTKRHLHLFEKIVDNIKILPLQNTCIVKMMQYLYFGSLPPHAAEIIKSTIIEIKKQYMSKNELGQERSKIDFQIRAQKILSE